MSESEVPNIMGSVEVGPTPEFPLNPLHDRIVIKRTAVEEKTAGGLYIPDTAKDKEKPDSGVIIAQGPGNLCEDGKRFPMSASIGDKVLYTKYAGTEIQVDGESYLIIRDMDLLAVYR